MRLNYITRFWLQRDPRVCKRFGNMIYMCTLVCIWEKNPNLLSLSPQVVLGMESSNGIGMLSVCI